MLLFHWYFGLFAPVTAQLLRLEPALGWPISGVAPVVARRASICLVSPVVSVPLWLVVKRDYSRACI
jgi:hypothetical protein